MSRLAELASDGDGRHTPPDNPRVSATSSSAPSSGEPVAGGPRWYRARIGRYGPIAGLIPMAILGAISFLALAASDGTLSAVVGLLTGCAAAPVLLLVGAPFGDSEMYPLAVVLSVPIWLAIGWLAALRTIRRPLPTWGQYATDLAVFAAAVLAGTGLALGLASWWVGGGLVS